jgi:hypothetical protein
MDKNDADFVPAIPWKQWATQQDKHTHTHWLVQKTRLSSMDFADAW